MAAFTPPSTSPSFAVLVFLKSLSTPVVLYADNPSQLYEEIRQILRSANMQSPRLIEKPGTGPLKKFAFLDTELSGVALQSEPPMPA